MNSPITCSRCGETITIDDEAIPADWSCPRCRTNLADREAVPSAEWSPTFPQPHNPASPTQDRVVTRSMLMPMPGVPTSAPAEMICRLEPRSLRWLELSDALQAFLGQFARDLTNQSFPQYLHPDDRALAEDELRQACEHGERYDLVLRIKSRLQEWHYMRISAQARYELDGRVNHIRCNLRDVTDQIRAEHELRRRTDMLIAANEQLRLTNHELKKTQSQLIQSEKLAALGTLAAGMAHEINNPLAFAVNNLVLLGREVPLLFQLLSLLRTNWDNPCSSGPELDSATRQLIEQIDLPYLEECFPRMIQSTHKGLIRVAQIVEKLCSFAQLGRAPTGEVDINEALDQCLMMLSDMLARSGITVDRQFGELPRTRGAVKQLNQVFLDLLANGVSAIEAAGRTQGRLILITAFRDDKVLVEIRDNGCGISPEDLPRIFDPFFTTKPLGRGMGLGLSLTHGIITKHGGQIEVESEIGLGTCFRLRFPMTVETTADEPQEVPVRGLVESEAV